MNDARSTGQMVGKIREDDRELLMGSMESPALGKMMSAVII
jgi:hypothetical protein